MHYNHQIWIHPHPISYTTTTCPYMYNPYITISNHYVFKQIFFDIQPIKVLKMLTMHLI